MKEASPSTESGIKERLRIQALDRIRLSEHAEGNCPLSELWINASKRMSAAAGMIRNQVQMETALKETEDDICQFMQKQNRLLFHNFHCSTSCTICFFLKNVSVCHVRLRKSRRRKPRFRIIYRFHRRTPRLSRLPNLWRIISLQTDQKMHGQEVQEVTLKEGTPSASRRPVRPLPDVDYFFENQWRIYRERMGMMD